MYKLLKVRLFNSKYGTYTWVWMLPWMVGMLLVVSVIPSVAATEVVKDPTMPAYMTKKPISTTSKKVTAKKRPLKLTFILVDEQQRLAIIDGRQVGVGAKVGTHKVIRIEADRVILDSGRTLLLFGSEVISGEGGFEQP